MQRKIEKNSKNNAVAKKCSHSMINYTTYITIILTASRERPQAVHKITLDFVQDVQIWALS